MNLINASSFYSGAAGDARGTPGRGSRVPGQAARNAASKLAPAKQPNLRRVQCVVASWRLGAASGCISEDFDVGRYLVAGLDRKPDFVGEFLVLPGA